jgi:hypothetical protein
MNDPSIPSPERRNQRPLANNILYGLSIRKNPFEILIVRKI